jgi:hypothetical protein
MGSQCGGGSVEVAAWVVHLGRRDTVEVLGVDFSTSSLEMGRARLPRQITSSQPSGSH